jgi:hypothetical protein
MLSKESKQRVLENFYALDYAFFGKPVTKLEACCPVLKEEYMSVKGALLSVFIEMLRLIDHSPEPVTEKIDKKALLKLARESAKFGRQSAAKLVKTEQAKADIKAEVKEALQENKNVNVSEVATSKIREKAFRLAVDNILVARAITESTEFTALNDIEGQIIESAYKVLRDGLCESAILLLDTDE